MAFALSPSKLLEYLLERVTILSQIFKDNESGKINSDSLPISDSINSDSTDTVASSAAVNIVNNRVTVNETSINNLSKQVSTTETKVTNLNSSVTNLTNQINSLNDKVKVATKTKAGIVIPGDGLNVTSNGTISVDFSEMPTDKFEALMKQIRVPVWISKSTNFYVNGETGSNTLDDGRGETQNKPFKTIQACINYVCDNLNLNRYSVYINVAPGTYEEGLTLAAYSTVTGSIIIRPLDVNNRPIVKRHNGGCVSCTNGTYNIQNIDFICTRDTLGSADYNTYVSAIGCSSKGRLTLTSCTCNFTYTSTECPQRVWVRAVSCTGGGYLQVFSGTYTYNAGANTLSSILFFVEEAEVRFTGSNDSQEACDVYINGNPTTNINVSNNSRFYIWGGANYRARVLGNATGKKYTVNGGSVLSTGGRKDEFPGNIAGTVDANTYSWAT